MLLQEHSKRVLSVNGKHTSTATLMLAREVSFFRKIKFLIDDVRWRILQGN